MKIRVELDMDNFSRLSIEDAFKEYRRIQENLSEEDKWKMLENLSSRVVADTEKSNPPMTVEEAVVMLESRYAEGYYAEE